MIRSLRIRRFLGQEAGSSMAEYGALLALVASGMLAVGLVVAPTINDALKSLSAPPIGLPQPQRQVVSATSNEAQVSMVSRVRDGYARALASTGLEASQQLGISVGAVVLIGALGMVGRRSGRQAQLAGRASEQVPTTNLNERAFRKWQQMMQVLTNQADLLLKNGLEVQHLMTTQLIAVTPDTRLKDLKELFKSKRLHHVLVIDDQQNLVGIVSDRDLYSRRGKTAAAIMTRDPLSVIPETPLDNAAAILINRRFSCLPVVKEGKPCGIITTTDVVMSLQCMMQLMFRVTHAVQDDINWEARLDELHDIGASLQRQHDELNQLDHDLCDSSATLGPQSLPTLAHRARQIAQENHRIHAALSQVFGDLQERSEHLKSTLDGHLDSISGAARGTALRDAVQAELAVSATRPKTHLVLLRVAQQEASLLEHGVLDLENVLQRFVVVLGELPRPRDLLAQLAADSLALLLTETDAPSASRFCKQLVEVLSHQTGAEGFCITGNVLSPEADETPESLLDRAALWCAAGANGGRNNQQSAGPADALSPTNEAAALVVPTPEALPICGDTQLV